LSEVCDARHRYAFVDRFLFHRGLCLREGLSEVEVAMDIMTIAALALAVLLLGYLVFTLLAPEKF
jgi:K+-transporting ATPase KdpF subunit